MKLLVIGIDGGTEKIIRSMKMPFLHEKLNEGINLDLEEDLWNRGWAAILNGQHGRDTGAFYYKPKLDGSHDTISHFGTENHETNGVEPLWHKLMSQGYKVGFMNVPTTMPAPEVEGFFISGAGGGFNPKDGLHETACYPNFTYKYLQNVRYPWQVRFMASGIKQIDEFVNKTIDAIEKRADAFVSFCRKFFPDFGFLVQSENTPIQNVAMVEVETLIEGGGSPKNHFQEKIIEFYSTLDRSIEKVFKKTNPENLIIVSDHSASPRRTSVNVNSFLQDSGLQSKKTSIAVFHKNLKKKLATSIPQSIKAKLRKTMSSTAMDLHRPDIDWKNTYAFGGRYIPGIYINDKDRFGGPVADKREKEKLSNKIIDFFNRNEEAINHGLHARLYRCEFPSSRHNVLLPEIWIESPDSVFFEGHGPFIKTNEDYHRIESLNDVTRDLFTGIKGRYPLACIDRKLAHCIDFNDSADLTQVYRIIERAMKS